MTLEEIAIYIDTVKEVNEEINKKIEKQMKSRSKK